MNFNNPKSFPLIGLAMAALFWIADSFIDALIFEDEQSFFDSLIHPDDIEIWMRCLVIILFLVFSLFARYQLGKTMAVTDELTKYKNDLEKIVAERTAELEKKNRELDHEITERKNIESELKKLASTDPLTTLYNRRKFEELLEVEINLDKRLKSGLFLIVCDIDYFKNLNDQYGHDVGDSVLREFSDLLRHTLHESDIVARWGGEEFIILIPNTSADIATGIAEKLKNSIASHEFHNAGKLTASFGITNFLPDDNTDTVIKRADVALYKAKENGRNRIELILG